MPDYLPTITTSATPWVEVTTPGAGTYQELQNALGSFVYQVMQVYLWSSSFDQLLENVLLKKYNKTGDRTFRLVPTTPDPYQTINSIEKDYSKLSYRLDSNSNFYFTIKAGVTARLMFRVLAIKNSDLLPGKDLFTQLQGLEGHMIDF